MKNPISEVRRLRSLYQNAQARAEADLAEFSRSKKQTTLGPVDPHAGFVGGGLTGPDFLDEREPMQYGDPLAGFRGLMWGLIFVSPFWILVALVALKWASK